MTPAIQTANALIQVGPARSYSRHCQLVERLIDRLPRRLQAPVRWLRRPSSRWARIPAGALLIGGGFLSILPVFGLWMLPVGLALLAEDVPPLRRMRNRVLDWIHGRWPHWLAGGETARPSMASPPLDLQPQAIRAQRNVAKHGA